MTRQPVLERCVMTVVSCTACEAGLFSGDRRCVHCGEMIRTAPSRQSASTPAATPLVRIASFFGTQAGLSLSTLVVFIGLGLGSALVPAKVNPPRLQSGTAGTERHTGLRAGFFGDAIVTCSSSPDGVSVRPSCGRL
jgi:hypothetical protein